MGYEWIAALKLGDDVLICDNSRWNPRTYTPSKVVRANSRFIQTTNGTKFSAKHGREYGQSGWSQYPSIENPADPEIQRCREEADKDRIRQRALNAACSIWDRVYSYRNRVSTEQWHAIEAVLEPVAEAISPKKTQAA